MHRFTIGSALLGLGFVLQSAAALSQSDDPTKLDFGLRAAANYSNNFYYQRAPEQTVAGTILSPEFTIARATRSRELGLSLAADVGAFSSSDSDSYSDARAKTEAKFDLSRLVRISFLGSAEWGHDPFGTERTSGETSFLRNVDKWTRRKAGITLLTGHKSDSHLQIELHHAFSTKRYRNNLDQTRFLDRDLAQSQATLIYRLSPKLGLALSGIHSDTVFRNDTNNQVDRSGKSLAMLTGMRWNATAKTSGDIRLGIGQWTPEDDSFEATRTGFWQVLVVWNASRTNKIELSGRREYQPTYRFDAQFIDRREMLLTWTKQWTYRFQSGLHLGGSRMNFVGADEQYDYTDIDFNLVYNLDRALKLIVSAGSLSRDAHAAEQEFESFKGSIGLEVKLN